MTSEELKKITDLERQLKLLTQQVFELNKRMQWLERENGRRKAEIQQAQRKG
jgi:peptidoglycan hydrolase CwlO-like protein